MRNLFNKILIISLLISVSCSKSDEQSNQVDVTPSVNNIELFVSSGEIVIGTTVLFTAFDNTGKNIALQIVSGREGISLRNAKYLVYYNIDFSATSYWQSRDRMTTKDRLYNKIYWVFSEKGIEKMIYKAVNNKKDYTLKHFKRDYESIQSSIPF